MSSGDMTNGSVGWSLGAAMYAETFALLCAGTFTDVLANSGIHQKSPTPLRVLDIGTGTGALAALAAEAGAEVTAVDPDPEMLRIAELTAPHAQLHRAGLPDLPFSGNSFDAVLANFVVNHLQDPRAGVEEIARVTKPGARVAVTI